jgi:hypothetical protein
MGVSLARQLLEGHRRASEPAWRDTRGDETWRVRVDHVVIGAERGALSLAAFHGLSLPRIRVELAMASPDDVAARSAPGSASERRWFQAARRWGAWQSRSGAGQCHRVYAERFASPGKLALFATDEAPSCGALGALAFTSGALEAASALASGIFELPAPRSVAVRGDWVYVLNTDGLARRGGASHALEGSDPAQVAFSPNGRTLLVTDRAANAIHAFTVDGEGIADGPMTQPSSGATPYGFDFRPDGTVVVTEAAGAEVGKATASSYRLNGGGVLEPVSGAVPSSRSEVCWAVVSRDGHTAFVTNFGDGTISSYAIGDDGSIELREAIAASTIDGRPGLRDEALSGDGRYLYALHADAREVYAWEVGDDGMLTALGSANGLPATAAGLAAS